jgi:hypothetical protein
MHTTSPAAPRHAGASNRWKTGGGNIPIPNKSQDYDPRRKQERHVGRLGSQMKMCTFGASAPLKTLKHRFSLTLGRVKDETN